MDPGLRRDIRTRSIELAEELCEVAVARLRGRGLEGLAEGGGDAGVSGRKIDADDLTIHVEFRLCPMFSFQDHQEL